MHGVSMSIGSSAPLDREYLRQVKALAARVEPRVDLGSPVLDRVAAATPMTAAAAVHEEALAHVVQRVRAVQELLGRRILLENVRATSRSAIRASRNGNSCARSPRAPTV